MAPVSDLTLDLTPFTTEAIDAETASLNDRLLKLEEISPHWWDVGPVEYRRMRSEGKHPFPRPVKVAHAEDVLIASREKGRDIKCRLIRPKSGIDAQGIYLHIHGGGWVFGAADGQDPLLDHIAQETGLMVISVGYRLAPEHPHPAAEEDMYDVAEYLVDNAKSEYRATLQFVGGESAGAQLSIQTVIHLLHSRPAFSFQGTVLSYGGYDMNSLPSGRSFVLPMFLTATNIDHFVDAYIPTRSIEDRRDPAVSPIYHPIFQHFGASCGNIDEGKAHSSEKLPPALFLVGTQDAVLDDTILMSAKWMIAGGQAVVKFIAGAPHGFMNFDHEKVRVAAQAHAEMMDFVKAQMHEGTGQVNSRWTED